jgi:hypothetical protein
VPADQRRPTQADLRQAKLDDAKRQAAAAEAQRAQALAEQQQAQQLALAEQQRQQQAQAQAQQALAQAMAAQQTARAEAAAAAAKAAPAPVVVAEAAPAAPPDLSAAQASTATDPTSAPLVPLPPRRPVELAADGPAAPLPPSRPTEFASLTPQDLAPAAPQQKDPIGALMQQRQIAGRAVNLPIAITQGPGIGHPPPLPPVLAYAAPTPPPSPVPVPKIAVPLPVARPSQFVAARLDRSNFRTLTASGATNHIAVRTAIGSAVSALRPAAQSSLGLLVGQVSAGAAHAFSKSPTALPTDRFSRPAAKPFEHVTTSTIAGGSGFRSSTE